MDTILRDSMSRARFITLLLSLAASIAILLSAVGIYGTISYLVSQRRQEIGVRMALGARMSQVSGQVVRECLALTMVGIAIGLAAALSVNLMLSTFLFETAAYDFVTLATTSASLAAVAALAAAVPARRAASIAPNEVLRD